MTPAYQKLPKWYKKTCAKVLIQLLLVIPVKIIRPLQDVNIKQLPAKATFECELNKSGVEVTWLKNGQPITDKRYRIENVDCVCRLHLDDVTDEDDGDYTVAVTADLKSEAGLTIQDEGWPLLRSLLTWNEDDSQILEFPCRYNL